jgi:hypothetical protein
VRHLIADHIGWFSHVQGHNLEDYYPGQVKKGTLADHLVFNSANSKINSDDSNNDNDTKKHKD